VAQCMGVENDHGRLQCGQLDAEGHITMEGRHIHVSGADGTFSQNYQDTWVMRLAASNGWIQQQGFFLDLGAFSGEFCSNSRLLEDILNWRGVCVEPFPNNTHAPSSDSFSKRKCALVPRALTGAVDGMAVTMSGGSDSQSMQLDMGRLGKTNASSSVGSDIALGGVARVSRGDGKYGHKGHTETISIRSLLNCLNASRPHTTQLSGVCRGLPQLELPKLIHFVSLDVEGLEWGALSSFCKYRNIARV
jgi:hypothetical protein